LLPLTPNEDSFFFFVALCS